MLRRHFPFRLLRAALLGTALAATCHAAPRAAGPVRGGTLTVGLATDTAVIDPSITGSSITALITRNVVDSLVGQAEDNRFTPWLAERWEVDARNTVYTFHLREGVTFSDGTPLDAAAVKFNFDRILDPRTTSSYSRSLLGPVAAIEAPDARRVVIRYAQPFAPLLQALSLPYLGIQSPTYLRNAASTTNSVVGSGPFILTSYTKGSGSRLERRADYHWGPGHAAHTGPAHLDALVFRYLPESSVRVGALTSGQVQAIDDVPPANARGLGGNPRLRLSRYENPGVNRALFLNTQRGVFEDRRVRQAFQSAADIGAAVRAVYFGTLKPADNILAPRTLHYDAAVAGQWGFDEARANRLLDEAGWSARGADGIRTRDGQRLVARFVYDTAAFGALNVSLIQAIQFAVKKAGFDLQLVPLDAGGYAARVASADYELASIFFVRAEPDILRTVFHSAFIPPRGANLSRVTDLDAALDAAIGAPDAERRRLYGEVQARLIREAAVLPVYIAAYEFGTTAKLQGLSWATNAKPLFYDAWLER